MTDLILCTTHGCDKVAVGGVLYDQDGIWRRFCSEHVNELAGVRGCLERVAAQINALGAVRDLLSKVSSSKDRPFKKDVRKELRALGAQLVVLLKRERELTGATERGK